MMSFISKHNFLIEVKGDQCLKTLCAMALVRILSNVPDSFYSSPVLFFGTK